MPTAAPFTIKIRANTDTTLSLGGRDRHTFKSRSIKVEAGKEYTIPRLDDFGVRRAREQAAEGIIEILEGVDSLGVATVRQVDRNMIVIQLGNGSALPNTGTLVTLGFGDLGSFVFGNANIDGADAAALLAAFKTAFEADADIAAAGYKWAGAATLGSNKGFAFITGEEVSDADWDDLSLSSNDADLVLPDVIDRSATADAVIAQSGVLMRHVVTSENVTAGFIAFDTGLADVEPLTEGNDDLAPWVALRIIRRVQASRVLTVAAGENFADGETVTIDGVVYTAVTELTGTDNEFLIGADGDESLDNLAAAINGDTESEGINPTQTAHPTVTATSSLLTLTATAKRYGTEGNSIAVTETAAEASWASATLTGGAVTEVFHNGSRSLVDGRIFFLTNDSSIDWQAGDVITLAVFGVDEPRP